MLETTEPDVTLQILKYSTYCLWVGAGISCQLARSGDATMRDWTGLVEYIEAQAGIVSQIKDDLPWRLRECQKKIGMTRFQRYLREELFVKLCEAIIKAAQERRTTGCVYSTEFRQIASLGFRANPIVSFNIEHLSSIALARAGGPCETRCFRMQPCLEFGYKSDSYDPPSGESGFRRLIYHPHGLITESGQCVMGADTYAIHGQDSSLGLRMAVHAAFDSFLVIVGMSMGEEYLRDQLTRHIDHIGKIYWFTDKCEDPATTAWAKDLIARRKLEVALAPWPKFWKAVDQCLDPPEDTLLRVAWKELLLQSCYKSSTVARLYRISPQDSLKSHLLYTGEFDDIASLPDVTEAKQLCIELLTPISP